jgi:ribonuclease HII
MDEVGRGALAGPVSVGAVAVGPSTRSGPPGVADSKLLSPAARQALLPALNRWGLARAVGHASAAEIDAVGIVAALRLAGLRALATLGLDADVVLLDGSHDWLSSGGTDQLELWEGTAPAVPAVHMRVKADRWCASVAAASVLAKCERDAVMVAHAAEHPAYGWADNKGYGAPAHLAALRELGPSTLHRRSWRLPAREAAPAGPAGPRERAAADGGDVAGAGWSIMDL